MRIRPIVSSFDCLLTQKPYISVAKRLYSAESRLSNHGPVIEERFASLRHSYRAPRYPVVLTHGLLGFDNLYLAGKWLPAIQYWRGIEEAMKAIGANVIVTAVPPAGSIAERAEALRSAIEATTSDKKVNIIAHSMGYDRGLDSRYMISKLKHKPFEVASLTTIATPHRGSSLADCILDQVGTANVSRITSLLRRLSISSGAFEQLTRTYMNSKFNPAVVDDPSSHQIIAECEGANDGIVSVSSSSWGTYCGTLTNVSHLDLINWTNRIRWWFRESLLGRKRTFNAVALYLDIAERLAQEGF